MQRMKPGKDVRQAGALGEVLAADRPGESGLRQSEARRAGAGGRGRERPGSNGARGGAVGDRAEPRRASGRARRGRGVSELISGVRGRQGAEAAGSRPRAVPGSLPERRRLDALSEPRRKQAPELRPALDHFGPRRPLHGGGGGRRPPHQLAGPARRRGPHALGRELAGPRAGRSVDRPEAAEPERTFGYHRSEVLAALANGVTLVAISVFVVVEAWHRFLSSRDVDGRTMMWIAVGGLSAHARVEDRHHAEVLEEIRRVLQSDSRSATARCRSRIAGGLRTRLPRLPVTGVAIEGGRCPTREGESRSAAASVSPGLAEGPECRLSRLPLRRLSSARATPAARAGSPGDPPGRSPGRSAPAPGSSPS